MKLKDSIQKHIDYYAKEIIHGKSSNRGNLPGVAIAHLEHRKRVLEHMLQLLDKNDMDI